MRKYFYVLGVVFILGVIGCRKKPNEPGPEPPSEPEARPIPQNVVFNPRFDMTPWDTGWTIETDTATDPPNPGYAVAIAEVKIDTGMSFPNCCFLRTYGKVYNQGLSAGSSVAKAMISQTFDEIIGCEVRAYVKYHLHSDGESWPARDSISIQVLINNEWKPIWQVSGYYYMNGDTLVTIWTEICTTIVNDTVSGIRFRAFSCCFLPCNGGYGRTWSYFWIDDVYVEDLGVEESEK